MYNEILILTVFSHDTIKFSIFVALIIFNYQEAIIANFSLGSVIIDDHLRWKQKKMIF